MEACLRDLILSYGKMRKPVESGLRIHPGRNEKEHIIQVERPRIQLPVVWNFCSYRRHIRVQVGERRDPMYTEMIERLCQDIEANPGTSDLESRVKRLFGL